jgi:hypothetical protein
LNFNKFEYFISEPRINRFLRATNNSKSKAQNLYRVNLRVAQSFYPILNLFEIFLRNSINYQISSYFTNPSWIITEKQGFMSDPSLSPSRFKMRSSVQYAERIIRQRGATLTTGKVIAEQTFGFWTSLFDTHHYRLIGGCVIHCFPNKPPQVNRNIINQNLHRVREFRNRIYHNEPICFNNNNHIDFMEAINIKDSIYNLLDWMDSDLVDYVKYFDNVDSKIDSANNIN